MLPLGCLWEATARSRVMITNGGQVSVTAASFSCKVRCHQLLAWRYELAGQRSPVSLSHFQICKSVVLAWRLDSSLKVSTAINSLLFSVPNFTRLARALTVASLRDSLLAALYIVRYGLLPFAKVSAAAFQRVVMFFLAS